MNGLLVFHLSNDHLVLAPMLCGLARERDLACLVKNDAAIGLAASESEHFPSNYAIIGRLGQVEQQWLLTSGWEPGPASDHAPVWTDEYSSLIRLLK